MCRRCDNFSEALKIEAPGQYIELVKKLRLQIDNGSFLLMKKSCNFEDITLGKPWPSDILEHEFECSSCRRRSRLFVDTYHGRGSLQVLE